jgi:hypothetical protein
MDKNGKQPQKQNQNLTPNMPKRQKKRNSQGTYTISKITIYTDGSKMEEGTGTGYIAYHRNCAITKIK